MRFKIWRTEKEIMKRVLRLPVVLCLLGLAAALLGPPPAVAHQVRVHDDPALISTAGDVESDGSKLGNFVKHAAEHLKECDTFEEAVEVLEEFRDPEGDWHAGSTYLILLTYISGVYVHAKNRDLEDMDWHNLKDAKGNGPLFRKIPVDGRKIEYYMEGEESPRVSYAFPFRAPAVPLGSPLLRDRPFLLVGGLNLEPPQEYVSYEDLPASDTVVPEYPASEVDDKPKLKRFVEEAIRFFQAAWSRDIDVVQLRRLFRHGEGPWRHGSTYIYIMDDKGNVIFNGANRNIEQTNLWDFPPDSEDKFIQRIIVAAKMPGGDFVEYNWNDPQDPNDDPPDGGAGGSSPKLGYAKAFPLDKEDPESDYYIFGSGLYLGSDTGDGGACAVAGTENTVQSTIFNLLLIVSALFLATSFRRHSA